MEVHENLLSALILVRHSGQRAPSPSFSSSDTKYSSSAKLRNVRELSQNSPPDRRVSCRADDNKLVKTSREASESFPRSVSNCKYKSMTWCQSDIRNNEEQSLNSLRLRQNTCHFCRQHFWINFLVCNFLYFYLNKLSYVPTRYTISVNVFWTTKKHFYYLHNLVTSFYSNLLTHWCLVTPYGTSDLGQHWLR